jgi:hypothetical protein
MASIGWSGAAAKLNSILSKIKPTAAPSSERGMDIVVGTLLGRVLMVLSSRIERRRRERHATQDIPD